MNEIAVLFHSNFIGCTSFILLNTYIVTRTTGFGGIDELENRIDTDDMETLSLIKTRCEVITALLFFHSQYFIKNK